MNHSGATEFSLLEIPAEFWIWSGVTLLLTAALGFAAGVIYARMSVKWAVRRARSELSRLYTLVLQTLDSAQEACTYLETYPDLALTADQTEQLDSKRTGLLETVARIVETQRDRLKAAEQRATPLLKTVPARPEWSRSSKDPSTGLPDRSAFDENLDTLLNFGSEAGVENGLLCVQVDKFSQLKTRFGTEEAGLLLRKLAGVVCVAARDEDLVCRFREDTLAVLMPCLSRDAGNRLADAIRRAVRGHQFQLEGTGAEVLVTASFGYTPCFPQDSAKTALDRASNALARSRRRGRNQLHVHDGRTTRFCRTA